MPQVCKQNHLMHESLIPYAPPRILSFAEIHTKVDFILKLI